MIFNINWNKSNKNDSKKFATLPQSLCLQQHASEATLVGGNFLDWVITHEDCTLLLCLHWSQTILQCTDEWVYISKPLQKVVTYRKLKSIDITKFQGEIVRSGSHSLIRDRCNPWHIGKHIQHGVKRPHGCTWAGKDSYFYHQTPRAMV